MGSAKRTLLLAYLDLSDSLKPPVFDLMVFTITFLSVLVSFIQLYSSPASLAFNLFGPVLLATALYLALRSASGIAYLVSSRQIESYLSYPLGRRGTALALYLSRVLVPSMLLLGIPAIAAGLVYLPMLSNGGGGYVAVFLGFLVQAIFYGSVFTLIALLGKSPGSSSILSLVFYFTYNILGLILATVSTSFQSILYRISQAMSFYLVVYQRIITPSSSPLRPGLVELLFVPVSVVVLVVFIVEYTGRRFEP